MARGNSSTFFWCYKSIFTSIEEGSAGLLMKFDLLQLVFVQDTARIVICLLHNFLYQLGWQVLFSMIKKFKIKGFFSSFLKGNFFYFKLIFFASVYELHYLSFGFFYFPIMYLIFFFSSENSIVFNNPEICRRKFSSQWSSAKNEAYPVRTSPAVCLQKWCVVHVPNDAIAPGLLLVKFPIHYLYRR